MKANVIPFYYDHHISKDTKCTEALLHQNNVGIILPVVLV